MCTHFYYYYYFLTPQHFYSLYHINHIFIIRVKCIFSTCTLSQNQIATLVFKNITNGTCGYQINPLGTSIRIPLIFLTKCHVTLTHGMVHVVSRPTWRGT
jgi:hypothetical protein